MGIFDRGGGCEAWWVLGVMVARRDGCEAWWLRGVGIGGVGVGADVKRFRGYVLGRFCGVMGGARWMMRGGGGVRGAEWFQKWGMGGGAGCGLGRELGRGTVWLVDIWCFVKIQKDVTFLS